MNNGHTGSGATYTSGSAGQETAVLKTLRIIRRRWRLLAGVWILVAVLFAAYAATRSESYRSEAVIEVGRETPTSAADLIGEISGRVTPPWENHFRTQEALLRRAGLLSDVLEQLPAESVAEYRASEDPVRRLSSKVTIQAVPSTFLIKIALDHRNPDHGPEIVNKLVSLFIEDSNLRLRQLKSGALDVINQEMLPDVRQKVEEAERRVHAYETEAGVGDISERHSLLLEEQRRRQARLFEVRMRLFALQTPPEPDPARLEGGGLAPDAQNLRGSARSLESLAARRSELEVELARQKAVYRDKHASVIALRSELDAVNVLIDSALAAAGDVRKKARAAVEERFLKERETVEEELRTLLEESRKLDAEIVATRSRLTRYQRLDTEVAAARDLYNSFLKKQVEIKAMTGVGVAGVRVVDLARQPVRNLPRTQVILTLGVVLGLLLGAGMVILVEQNDDRAATPHEAENALKLDLLSAVPSLHRPAGTNGQPLVVADALDPSLEPFRRLRSEIAARLRTPGPKMLAVVGPMQGEGKSTVAINLARTFALEGRRVLLLDADLRHPRLRALLGSETGPGLEECILNGHGVRECIRPSRIPGIDILGAKSGIPGAAEVPGMPRFRAAMLELRTLYDFVIVDAGSVNRATEVAEVASHAEGAVFVLDESRTQIRQSILARRTLENQHVRILGLVVNRSEASQTFSAEFGRIPFLRDIVEIEPRRAGHGPAVHRR